MSGQIIGQGMVGAAATQAESMGNIGQNIGNALTTLAAAYGQRQGTIAKGKNFKKFMGMAGSAFGIDDDKLGMFNEMEDFDAGIMLDNFGSWMPAMANAQLGRDRMGVTQQGQQIQQNAPYVAADIKNRQNIAGGNVPHGGGGGMAPVEPPLPPYSPAPVSQPPAPSANPASSIPGGDESMRRYNEWKSKRGS